MLFETVHFIEYVFLVTGEYTCSDVGGFFVL